MRRSAGFAVLLAAASVVAAYLIAPRLLDQTPGIFRPSPTAAVPSERLSPFQRAVVGDLDRQVASNIWYQDRYYQGGDPPPHIGVCTDVVIRSFRAGGVDLRRLVASDIRGDGLAYGIARPDPNIDHRRVRNLAIFFKRHARTLPTSGPHADWQPGDIVVWNTHGDGVPDHIGVISDHLDSSGVPTVVHHWPGQMVAEMDWLYKLPILYHFRWRAEPAQNRSRRIT